MQCSFTCGSHKMKRPEWLKSGLWGVVAGAVALTVVGFSAGGWVTSAKADRLAAERAKSEVVAALVPICLVQAQQDPQAEQRLANLRDAASYKRREIVIKCGVSDDARSERARSERGQCLHGAARSAVLMRRSPQMRSGRLCLVGPLPCWLGPHSGRWQSINPLPPHSSLNSGRRYFVALRDGSGNLHRGNEWKIRATSA